MKKIGKVLLIVMTLFAVGSLTIFADSNLELGQTVSITTEKGSFSISIEGANLVENSLKDFSDKVVNLLCIIENRDYKTWESDEDISLTAYGLTKTGFDKTVLVNVKDADGFSLDYFDITPYSDGDYHSESVAGGSKARICIPLLAPADCSGITVDIYDGYSISFTFDAEGKGHVSGDEVSSETLEVDNSTNDAEQENSGNSELDTLKTQLSSITAEIEQLKSENEALRKANEELNGENENLKAQLEALTSNSGTSNQDDEPITEAATESVVATTSTQSEAEVTSDTVPISFSDKLVIAVVQQALTESGYDSGKSDGIIGNRTTSAISAYENANGMPATGAISDALIDSLGIRDKVQAAAEKEASKGEYASGTSYEAMSRNPDVYTGKKVTFKGKVLQDGAQDETNRFILLHIDSDYDQLVRIIYDSSLVNYRILEDDQITVYGIMDGIYTYTSINNQAISVPSIVADILEISYH